MICQKKNNRGITNLLKQIANNICRSILVGRLVKIMRSIRRRNGNAINLLVSELHKDRFYGYSVVIMQILRAHTKLQIMVSKRNVELGLVL